LFVLLFIAWGFYLSNMGNLHSNRVWDTMTLGGIFLIMLFIIPIWLIYKDLKDSSGLTNFIPLVLQIKKSSLFTPCFKCKKIVLAKTSTCPNCGEPVPKNV